MTDEQDGLGRLHEPLLEPTFGRDIQIVVGFIQQQDLVGPAQQRFQNQSLLLTAGKCVDAAKSGQLIRNSERGCGVYVALSLEFVAANVGPVRQRLCVLDLVLLTVALHECQLRAVEMLGGPPDAIGCYRQQQIADRRIITNRTDELPHHSKLPTAGDGSVVWIGIASDNPQQCRLTGPVGAYQGGLAALADPQADIVK
ncbi:Uncharacterised protein [Mycobacteroides abscessus subsp. abscessus]|nr:Uncharacterised protein [Mycobacteroides abscessus subsp. abscessus]